jgi:DedD protein
MDRRVKERLVGASILVVLIVLIAPELLSGPAPGLVTPRLPVSAPEPTRNVSVDLTTNKAPAPEPAAEPAAASSAEPLGTGSGDAASGAVAEPTPASSAPSASPAPSAPSAAPVPVPSTPLETTAPPPTSAATAAKPAAAGHSWAVQLGSFASHANADKLVRKLKAQGFSVYVLSGGSGASVRYRVRVGPLADRGAAAQAAARLKSLGHVGSLVSPAS